MAQLDSRIILGGQPAQIHDPFETYARMQQIGLQQESAKAMADDRAARAAQQRQQTEKLKQDAEESAALKGLTDWTAETVYPIVGPERGAKLLQGFEALRGAQQQRYGAAQTILRDTLLGMEAAPEGFRATAYPSIKQALVAQGVIQPTDAPDAYDPGWWARTVAYGKTPVAAQGFTLNPGDVRFDASGQQIASVPKPAETPQSFDAAILAAHRAGDSAEVRRLSQLKGQLAAAGRAPAGDGSKFWVMRDGKAIRVSDATYQPGDLPANTREQGRPVTSGDAGRLAEFDTALDDLGVLRTTVEGAGSTGTLPKLGAMAPNVVTELTGWGAEAKSRQGVIDRVKQVIGKALEGGVLRKEDEVKYEKILPTISDVASVVKTKLEGLTQAIELRRSRQIDALEDAGYAVDKFRARETKPASTPKTIGRFEIIQ